MQSYEYPLYGIRQSAGCNHWTKEAFHDHTTSVSQRHRRNGALVELLAAFALGLVNQDEVPRRVARNESLTHTGNAVFAVAAGAVGTLLALQGIFFAAAVFAAGMAPAALFIRGSEVSYEAAREDGSDGNQQRSGMREFWGLAMVAAAGARCIN